MDKHPHLQEFGSFEANLINNSSAQLDGTMKPCKKRSLHEAGFKHSHDSGNTSSDDEGLLTFNMHNGATPYQQNLERQKVAFDQKDNLPHGKKTKGRVKIKMEFIDNKLRRYTTFSKRKTGIMKKAYELSTLTGTQVMLLVASETGHVYTFATRKLQPMITSEAGKALIQTCLNSPDPPSQSLGNPQTTDQRMSATGYEETELSYAVTDEEPKVEDSYLGDKNDMSSCSGSDSSMSPSPLPNFLSYSNSKELYVVSPMCSSTSVPVSSKVFYSTSKEPISEQEVDATASNKIPASSTYMFVNSGGSHSCNKMNDSVANTNVALTAPCIIAGGNVIGRNCENGVLNTQREGLMYASPQTSRNHPVIMNLAEGVQFAHNPHGNPRPHQISSLPISLSSGATIRQSIPACYTTQSISHDSNTSIVSQALPTDLSIHVKREDSSSY